MAGVDMRRVWLCLAGGGPACSVLGPSMVYAAGMGHVDSMGRAVSIFHWQMEGPIGILSLRFEINEEDNEEREGRDLLLHQGEQVAHSMVFAKHAFEYLSEGDEDAQETGRDLLL